MSERAPRIAVPRGACDTHMHIYDTAVPSAPGGPPLPGNFPVAAYQGLQRRLGLERVIVVQPNAYQDDNRVTLAAIAALGPGAKGVGVVKPGVSDAELDRLTRGGIVAQRIFQLPAGAVGFDKMDEVMARVGNFGWHANIQLDGRELPQYEAQIKRLEGKFVIDHVGKFLEPVAPDHASFQIAAAPRRHRPLLGEALGALRGVEDRRAEVRGRRPPRESAREARAGADDVGEQLAASVGTEGCRARRRRSRSTCCSSGRRTM